ncbi:amidohydrolase family protein [Amycolatopsis rhabdoformis]|uniref:Amidohydrolase family protein n=1 Tax=Amycolatopsis rhabdoformis TaxID=1448059 RepID=A0ABZ1HY68_9PSEU|nr:amidohydrolase family protein [Amycolatopsis rhabdoformis]WSE26507.1 amidohydrolase family protein [Amycolatopsis rhabdoformis]
MTLLALRAARLFDGTASALVADPVLVLEGGVVRSVDHAVPPGATVVDLGDATLLPGLVDTHVHLAFDASEDPVGALLARDEAQTLAAMTAAGRQAAYGGVTTVRDLGDRDYLSLVLRASDDPALPTIVAAGPPLTTPRGHCHYLGGEVTSAESARAAVREHAERGVDVIKLIASGGNLTPGTRLEVPQFAPDVLRAAVAEAHRLSLPVTAHAHGTQPVIDALAAGVDGLEHATFMTTDGVDEAPPDLVREIAERHVTVGVTLGIVVPDGTPLPGPIASRRDALVANLRAYHRAGVQLTAGTDAGIMPIKPPDVLRYAVHMLEFSGMSTVDTYRAVTSVAAGVCGLGHRKGRLAPGFDADVLAVRGDPFTDPAALHDIRAVYVRGVAVRGTPVTVPPPR